MLPLQELFWELRNNRCFFFMFFAGTFFRNSETLGLFPAEKSGLIFVVVNRVLHGLHFENRWTFLVSYVRRSCWSEMLALQLALFQSERGRDMKKRGRDMKKRGRVASACFNQTGLGLQDRKQKRLEEFDEPVSVLCVPIGRQIHF